MTGGVASRLGSLAGLTGRGVRVALIDSGVAGLPALDGVALEARGRSDDVADRSGHGTSVAWTLKVWAPDADLLVARIFGRRTRCSAGRAMEALRWAADRGADVALLSLAGLDPDGWPEALAEAAAAGTVVVAAVANRRGDGFPACLPGALGVASSGEPGLFRLLPGGAGPDLEAPPYSGPSRRGRFRGTSIAAAHAAGLAARIREAEPGADLLRVRERLAGLFG